MGPEAGQPGSGVEGMSLHACAEEELKIEDSCGERVSFGVRDARTRFLHPLSLTSTRFAKSEKIHPESKIKSLPVVGTSFLRAACKDANGFFRCRTQTVGQGCPQVIHGMMHGIDVIFR